MEKQTNKKHNKQKDDSKNKAKIKLQTKEKDSFKEKKEYRKFCLQKFEEFNNNGKLTVAIFCDTFFPIVDGVINVLDNYAKRLVKMCNVVVFVPEHKGKTVKKEYLVYGIKSLYFKFVNYDLAFPELDTDFKKVIKHLRIDIIHSHSPFFVGQFAVKLAKKLKIPLVSTFHSQYKQDFYKNTKSESLTKMLLSGIMKVFNSSTEVWTMHQKSLETLISYGFKGSSFLIPNATDFVCPPDIDKLVNEIDEKYHLKNVENVFLFVGRLVETKNILFIVDVMNNLAQKKIPYKMVFVGDGPDEAKLKAKIKKLNLKDSIILTGRITDKNLLGAFYKRADLFVFPSLYDVSSIVQIEAACFGLPVIFAEGSVTSCTVTKDVNGFIAPANVEDFSNAIIKIISDKAKLQQVSINAHNELYVTWDDVIDTAFERYIYLIDRNKKKMATLHFIKNNKKLINSR